MHRQHRKKAEDAVALPVHIFARCYAFCGSAEAGTDLSPVVPRYACVSLRVPLFELHDGSPLWDISLHIIIGGKGWVKGKRVRLHR